MTKKRLGIPLLVAIGLLLTAGVVYADMKMNTPVRAWDAIAASYTNALQPMPVDCVTWIPFWYEFNWDNDVYPTKYDLVAEYYVTTGTEPYTSTAKIPYPTDACPNDPYDPETGYGDTTQWASVFEYAVYHDNPEEGVGYGFKWTRNWELVECDRDGDNEWEATGPGNDMIFLPANYRNTIINDPGSMDEGFAVLAQNVITGAESVGNAESELITTLFVNLDTNCDGTIDEPFATYINEQGAVCFYAEALVPCPPGDLLWGTGNVQARVSRLGGEVTINFHQEPVTPVELSSFTARWYEDRSPLLMVGVVTAILGGAALSALVWRLRPVRR
jgi:hypothetical protein